MDPAQAWRLDDRVVVVTGASSGLGARFAEVAVAAGAHVVLAARRADLLDEVAARLRDGGGTVLARPTDIRDPDDCRALVDAAVDRFGRVDGLVNNAGVGSEQPASRETPETFRAVIDVNLLGTFWMSQACATAMPAGSAIVNVASVLGLVASRFPQAPYSASKAGVIGLTRALAQEWSLRKGIRVNALCPGYFLTEMTAAGEEALRPTVEAGTILRRFGEVGELDAALLFLLGPGSSYVTGTTLTVDGGMTAV